MTQIRYQGTANDAMERVRELRAMGMIQGQDFDFVFHPSNWDQLGGTVPSYTIFKFYNEKYATMFALKFSNHD